MLVPLPVCITAYSMSKDILGEGRKKKDRSLTISGDMTNQSERMFPNSRKV